MSESARIVNLLICVATDLEGSLLRERLSTAFGARVIVTGVGPVNAAHATTVAILANRPSAIVVCGIGGAYPSSGFQVGDVVSAAVEIYGDLGAQSPTGFLDMKALGFPVVKEPTALFNELPMQILPTEIHGRFVTVSTCTGTAAVAKEIEVRTGGAVENMEGAAVAHVAHLHGISVGEIRGISNIVTNRDVKSWRMKESAAAAQEALLHWIDRA
jgi:futalosine hydrolase